MEVKQIFQEKQVQLCQSSAAWAGIGLSKDQGMKDSSNLEAKD